MVIFASRSIDEWWQSGKGQPPYDTRRHDLSDGICLVGLTSKAKPLQKISSQGVELRNDDSSAVVSIAGQTVSIKTGADVKIEASSNVTIKGKVMITGDVEVQGQLKTSGNVDVQGGLKTGGDVVAGHVSLTTHTHPVSEAPGETGVPT